MSLFFALSLIFLSSLLVYRDRRFFFPLLILALPLNNRLVFDLGFAQVLPIRLVMCGVGMGAFLSVLPQWWRARRSVTWSGVRSFVQQDAFLFFLILLGFVRILSLLQVQDRGYSLGLLFFFLVMGGMYLFGSLLIHTKALTFDPLHLAKTHLSIVLVASVVSVVQYLSFRFYGRVLPGVWPSEYEPTRYGSLFWDINHYAPYVASVIPGLLIALLAARDRLSSLRILFFLSVSGVSLLLTLSRSGWLGAAFALLCTGVFLLRYIPADTRKFLTLSSFFGLLFLVYLLLFDSVITQRLRTLSTSIYNGSRIAHVLINRGHLTIFAEHPVLGGGYGNFNEQFRQTPYALQYFVIDKVEDVRLPGHSVWFEVLSDTGTAGMIAFGGMVVVLFLSAGRLMRTVPSSEKAIALGASAAIAGVLFSGIFYSYNLEYFWFFLFFVGWWARARDVSLSLRPFSFLLSYGLVLLGVATIFPGLGTVALIDWDESIYAEVAHNILRLRDPLTLHWQWSAPWFEKPPLYFWLTALTYVLYDVNEWSARLWSAIGGVAGAFIVYRFGCALKDKTTGIIAAATLLSTVHWLFQSRNGTLDVFTATLIAASLSCFYLAFEKASRRVLLFSSLFLGLTFMTKGVVMLIPLLVILSYSVIRRLFYHASFPFTRRELRDALLLWCAVVLPWHLLLWARHGNEFLTTYIGYHVLARAQGIEGHDQSLFWYVTVIRTWSRHNFVLTGIAGMCVLYWSIMGWVRKRELPDPRFLYLLLWMGITFGVLSASVSKIQWYIMPIYPAMALLVGLVASRVLDARPHVIRLGIVMLFVLSVPYFKNRETYRKMWDVEDAWRGVAEVVPYMEYEARKIKKPELLIVNLSPGPAMFYSEYPTRTITYNGVVSIAEKPGTFFAVGRAGDAQKLQANYPEFGVNIFKQYDDYVLFGRW